MAKVQFFDVYLKTSNENKLIAKYVTEEQAKQMEGSFPKLEGQELVLEKIKK